MTPSKKERFDAYTEFGGTTLDGTNVNFSLPVQ
jgi:hypothetical protein